MRACELIKETFCRKLYIWIVNLSWLAFYGFIFVLFHELTVPESEEFYTFLFVWSGCLLPFLLSTGIFGDDIASGRICVLVTKPFWSGELYVYRFMGLSLQAFLHLVLAGCIIFVLHSTMGIGNIDKLGLWLLSSWLLFNTWAAMLTSVSIVVRRAHDSLFVFVILIFVYILVGFLMTFHYKGTGTKVFMGFLRYAGPPFELLWKLAKQKYSLTQSVACVVHSLVLTLFYSIVGIIILSKQQFTCERD
jgi:hypothetical protein